MKGSHGSSVVAKLMLRCSASLARNNRDRFSVHTRRLTVVATNHLNYPLAGCWFESSAKGTYKVIELVSVFIDGLSTSSVALLILRAFNSSMIILPLFGGLAALLRVNGFEHMGYVADLCLPALPKTLR